MSPVPAQKADALLSEISALVRNSHFDDFAFRRINREIEALVKIDPPRAYMLRGMVYDLMCNTEDMKRSFQNAITIEPNNDQIAANYAISLGHHGFFSDALKASVRISKKNRGDIQFLRMALTEADHACRFDIYFQLAEEAEQLGKLSEDIRDRAISWKAVVARRPDIDPVDLSLIAEEAYAPVREARLRNTGFADYFDTDGALYRSFVVVCGAEQAAKLNILIADRLISRFSDPLADMVTFKVQPSFD